MSIAEDIYARCRFCSEQAAHILSDICDGKKIDPITVQARRNSADIAGDTFYTMLRQTFITPIDREDLWLMYQAAEAILCEAENTALTLCEQEERSPVCEAMIRAAAACCSMTKERILSFPRSDISAQYKRILRKAEHTCCTVNSSVYIPTQRIRESVRRVIDVCEQFITVLEYATLKNT